MKKIMFVCLGNICRSPLAQAVFESILDQHGCIERYQVDSSGTTAYHAGDPADGRMSVVARSRGIIINHRSQQLKKNHLQEFDLMVCMDEKNRQAALAMARSDLEKSKICLLRDFDPQGPGDVPDPYYGGEDGFEEVFEIVLRSAESLFEHLEKSEK